MRKQKPAPLTPTDQTIARNVSAKVTRSFVSRRVKRVLKGLAAVVVISLIASIFYVLECNQDVKATTGRSDFLGAFGLTTKDAPTMVIHDTAAGVKRALGEPLTKASAWRFVRGFLASQGAHDEL